jgi:hypothetical protein
MSRARASKAILKKREDKNKKRSKKNKEEKIRINKINVK